MGRKSTIYELPLKLQEQLMQRLLESGFSDYAGHTAWLAEQGYTVSKSAVHRFGMSSEEAPHYELRMRCAEIASRYSTSDTIIGNAKALMRWINSPHS